MIVAAAVLGAAVLGGGTRAAAPTPAAPPDLLTQASLLLDGAFLARDATERFRLADRAVALCERAAAARPTDPEPVLRLVQALTIADPDRPETCRPGRCERALEQLRRLPKIDPHGLEAARAASEEAIVLSRMQRFEEALAAYERALPLVEPTRRANALDDRGGLVLVWSNSAETAMALGRLDEAIRRYELAIEQASYGETEWVLSHYGLGVALDRDGQVERARQAIGRALERDPGLARLHEDGVFFEPPGDLAYYEALAHEVAGDEAAALEAWLRYLAAQPASRHAARARAHVAALGRRAGAALGRPPLAIVVDLPVSDRPRRPPEGVRARIEAHLPELSVCYARLLREHPGLSVRLAVALEISPRGGLTQRARVVSTSESALPLVRCVELSADGWRFAPLSGGGDDPEGVVVPMSFAPGALAAPR